MLAQTQSDDKAPNRHQVCRSTSPSEQRDWLLATPGWRKLDLNIIDTVILRYASTTMFEVFLATSQELHLVEVYRNLADQAAEHRDDDVILGMSAHLAHAGNKLVSVAAKHLTNREHTEAMEPARVAQNALDSALVLDADQLPAYVGRALLARVFRRNDESISIAKTGLERAQEIAMKRPSRSQSPFGPFQGFDAATVALKRIAGSAFDG